MELSKNFDHNTAEQKWYRHWLDKKYFHSQPDDRESYTIVIPPPNVTGTDRFPSSGLLQIDDDIASGGEYVRSSSKTATTFTITLVTDRGLVIGGASGVAQTHERGDVVYPVTTLTQPGGLASDCTLPTSFTIAANSKFLPAGTIDIQGEEILYTGSSTTGGTMTLTGVRRCQGFVGPVSHALNSAVTPVLANGDSAVNEAYVSSVGTVANTLRRTVKTIQR